jgi:hypothetical protein
VNRARLELRGQRALEGRERPASMRWWNDQLKTSVAIPPDVGQRVLVDDTDKFLEDWDHANRYPDLELEPWLDDRR